ncbi:MAG: hypothetical protein PUP46_05925 [Endozoicomonas sp. (ex Botrylloides leachii)]|nr:hypothetical protein [Endozoicomonas sp. (ex Botrylloides leachii)]
MQKIKLINLKMLPKTSALVHKEAEELLKKADKLIAAQEDFFLHAGASSEDIQKALSNNQIADEIKEQFNLWKMQFDNELAQAKSDKKKEMKLAERLLIPRDKKTKSSSTKRCTRIF